MLFRNLLAGVIGTVIAATMADAATYKAYSNVAEGAHAHSVWFSSDGSGNPSGSTGDLPNHFLFENGNLGYGMYTDDGSTTIGSKAQLVGQVGNAGATGIASQVFSLVMNMVVVAYPGDAKIVPGASTADWIYYALDTTKANVLTYLGLDGALKSFDISLRGNNLAIQVGTGANDKDKDLYGLSSWITLSESNCTDTATTTCESYSGDINIILQEAPDGFPPVPLPAGGLLLITGLGGLGFYSRNRRKRAV